MNTIISGMGFIDAHLHMTDPRFKGYDDMDDASKLFSCTASPSEWDGLTELSSRDVRVVPFYGIHPWNLDEYEGQIKTLESILLSDLKACVGEIGMDGMHPDLSIQNEIFREQLNLASELGRPASVHMVKAEREVLDAIRSIDSMAIIHSFIGPKSYIKAFAKEKCYFSISPRLMTRSEPRIKGLLDAIPHDRLLLETDAPDIRGYDGMHGFIEDVAKIMSMPADDLERLTAENAMELMP